MNGKRTTPFGLWRYGDDFRKAAFVVLIEHSNEVFIPYYFLLGQSIELSLKAFLLDVGITLKELRSRKFGHNLNSLLNECHSRNIENYVKLENRHFGVIGLLNLEYQAKRFQYIQTGRIFLPEQSFVQEAANLLSYGLRDMFINKK